MNLGLWFIENLGLKLGLDLRLQFRLGLEMFSLGFHLFPTQLKMDILETIFKPNSTFWKIEFFEKIVYNVAQSIQNLGSYKHFSCESIAENSAHHPPTQKFPAL